MRRLVPSIRSTSLSVRARIFPRFAPRKGSSWRGVGARGETGSETDPSRGASDATMPFGLGMPWAPGNLRDGGIEAPQVVAPDYPSSAGGGEAAAHGVLGDGARQDELRAGSRGRRPWLPMPDMLEAAERLAVDQGAGDLAVDVEVADAELALRRGRCGRAAREEAAGQGVVACRWRCARASSKSRARMHGQHRAEDLLLGDAGLRVTSAKMCGPT